MTPDKLIIQDFEFQEYPIVKTYKLGDKTVIQIDNEHLSRNKLSDDLDRLQSDYDALEKEKDELSDELESIGDAATVKAHKEELQRLEEAFDRIEGVISHFAADAGVCLVADDVLNIDTLHEKYLDLKKELDEADEIIGGFRVDNTALAHTIFRQEQTIARLEEKLATK